MAANFAVRPMPHRHHPEEVMVFTLPERLLDRVPIQAGLNDFVRAPRVAVCDDDIFPELVYLLADSVVILAKTHVRVAILR